MIKNLATLFAFLLAANVIIKTPQESCRVYFSKKNWVIKHLEFNYSPYFLA